MRFIYLTKDSTLECDREKVLVNGDLIKYARSEFLTSRIIENGERPPVGATVYFVGARYEYNLMTVVETVEEISDLLRPNGLSPHLNTTTAKRNPRSDKLIGIDNKPLF